MRYQFFAGLIAAAVMTLPAAAQEQPRGPSANEPSKTLSKGTKVETKTTGEVSSGTHRIGDTVAAVIVADVKDSTGMVIIPKNSMAMVEITDIVPPDKNHPHGVMQVAVRSVKVNGQDYRVKGAAKTQDKKPGWSVSGKKEAGAAMVPAAAIGIVADPKGKVVGTDVVLPAGSAVTFDLGDQAVTLVAS